ncbi:MAG TPA: hypothetical protein VGK53_06760 [Propionicimonas sp.]
MNLRDYLSILRDYWKSILIVTVAGVLAAIGVIWATGQSAAYVSRAAVFLTVARGDTAVEVVGGAQYAESQAQAYARLADMQVVLAPVVEKLGLPISPQELETYVTTWGDSSLVQVQVSYPDEKASSAIANAIAERLVTTVERLSPVDANGRRILSAEVVSPAGLPMAAESGLSSKSVLALGLLAGLVIALAQASLRKVLALSTANEH